MLKKNYLILLFLSTLFFIFRLIIDLRIPNLNFFSYAFLSGIDILRSGKIPLAGLTIPRNIPPFPIMLYLYTFFYGVGKNIGIKILDAFLYSLLLPAVYLFSKKFTKDDLTSFITAIVVMLLPQHLDFINTANPLLLSLPLYIYTLYLFLQIPTTPTKKISGRLIFLFTLLSLISSLSIFVAVSMYLYLFFSWIWLYRIEKNRFGKNIIRKNLSCSPCVLREKINCKNRECLYKISVEEVFKKAVKIEFINPNRYQPRKLFNRAKLKELAVSLKENGIIQPIIVTKRESSNYELVAGERRLEAAKLAGFEEVPVIIRSISLKQQLQFAIIENVQREDLNALEEAAAYQRLNTEFQMTHSQISEIVGKDRATITNLIRLLKLNGNVQKMILKGELSPGHARTILQIPSSLQDEFAQVIKKNKYSVRKAESAAKSIKNAGSIVPIKEIKKGIDSEIKIEKKLSKLYKDNLSNLKSPLKFFNFSQLNLVYFHIFTNFYFLTINLNLNIYSCNVDNLYLYNV